MGCIWSDSWAKRRNERDEDSKQELETQLEELRKENSPLKAQVESICSIVIKASRPRNTEQEKLAHDLFADNLPPKPIIEHSFNENSSRKRQFSWDIYRKLMEDVHDSPIDDKTFNTSQITSYSLDCQLLFVK